MKKFLLCSVALAALAFPAYADSDLPTCDGITTGSCAVKRPFANTDVGGTKVPRTIHVDVTNTPTGTSANPVVTTVVGAVPGTDNVNTVAPIGALSDGATAGKAQAIMICRNHAKSVVSTSGNAQLVAGVAGQNVRICWIKVGGITANKMKITQGTGTNCGTSTADLSGTYYIGDNGSDGVVLPLGSYMVTANTGNAVCANSNDAEEHSIEIGYSQY